MSVSTTVIGKEYVMFLPTTVVVNSPKVIAVDLVKLAGRVVTLSLVPRVVLAVISLAWAVDIVVVSPANAVVLDVPNPGKVVLAVLAVIALAWDVVIPVLSLLVLISVLI